MPHSSRSWCQSAELRASREHSRPRTIPARPRDTSATSCWNPSRSAAQAPDWPWSMSITVIWPAAQPSAIALPRRSYWRIADSVLCRTCLRLDWRTYKSAVLDRWAAVTFDAAVPVSTGAPSRAGRGRDRGEDGSGAGECRREPGQGVDELGGRRAGQGAASAQHAHRPSAAPGCARRRLLAQVGQGPPPGGDALAGEHAEAERERGRACVQGGMTQLLVAGVQPAAGSSVLAGIRGGDGPVQQPRGQVKVSRDRDGFSSFPYSGRAGQRLLECAPGGGPALVRWSGGARARRTPRSMGPASAGRFQGGIGRQLLLGPGAGPDR